MSSSTPPESLDDIVGWARFYFNIRGVNCIPCGTKYKQDKELLAQHSVEWKEFQHRGMTVQEHEDFIAKGLYESWQGVAVCVGRVYRGPFKGKWVTAFDGDNAKGSDLICYILSNGRYQNIQELAEDFIVEQHSDRPEKCHVIVYSDTPFRHFAGMSSKVPKENLDQDKVPAIEIKSKSGVIFEAPSRHHAGERYLVVGTSLPKKILSEREVFDCECRINESLAQFGITDLDENGNISKAQLRSKDFTVTEGNNRHLCVLRIADFFLFEKAGRKDPDQAARRVKYWNQKHCIPPLEESEVDRLIEQAKKYVETQIAQEEHKGQRKKQTTKSKTAATVKEEEAAEEEEEPPIEVTEDLTKEITLADLEEMLSISIRQDKTAKLIAFLSMLLSQTSNDQVNIAFQAESAAGKSYIALEIASFFPEREVIRLASASPTSFFHGQGKWDKKTRTLTVNLEHKILCFLDMPDFRLLARLRSFLSHDQKELEYLITDKSKNSGNRTKTVKLRGYCTVVFCSANFEADEQEKTRLIMLSPSIRHDKIKEGLKLVALKKSNAVLYNQIVELDTKRKWLKDRIRAIRQTKVRNVRILNHEELVLNRFLQDHPRLKPRDSRDFGRIISLIKACALLNVYTRSKVENDPSTIDATEADINAAFELYQDIATPNEMGLSPYIWQVFEEVLQPAFKPTAGSLTIAQAQRHYHAYFHKPISNSALSDVLQQLESANLIELQQDPEDKRKRIIVEIDLDRNALPNAAIQRSPLQQQQQIPGLKSIDDTPQRGIEGGGS